MEDNDVKRRFFYDAQIDRAVGLIVSASKYVKARSEVGKLHAASLDVDKRIGLLMEKISATQARKEVKKDGG